MKINKGVICMLAVFVFAVSPTVSLAQRSGSHVGMAHSGNSGSSGRASGTPQGSGFHVGTANPPAASARGQVPATVTRGTLVANPSVPNPVYTPHPIFGSSRTFTPNPAFIANQFAPPEGVFDLNPFEPQVTVPTHILDPGQTIIPTPTVPPIPPVVQPVVPPVHSTFGPLPRTAQWTPLVPGMSRQEVLLRLGQPSGSIATRTSETLFFDGGLKIILENGQVTGAR